MRNVSFFFLYVVCLAISIRAAAGEAVVSTRLTYFDLSAVRLLESPFRQAQKVDQQYVLALSADRLLAGFRIEAGLSPKAEKYGNWESIGLDGHTLGHYLTAVAQMWAATGDPEIKKRLDYCVSELAACQAANGNGYVGAVPKSKEVWKRVAAGHFEAQGFSLGGAWVPWYNMHKTFAGLRDAWLIGHNAEARDVLIRLTDWCNDLISRISDADLEIMLRAEHGGMTETLADVFSITGDKKYLALAQRFTHHAILDDLLQRRDTLTGKHANTQIPKVIGFARVAELGGDSKWDDAAIFFWETVTQQRSVAFGGNSVSEHFNPKEDFSRMVESREGPESCNTYNMLRLSEALFRRRGEARYADYYERALYNHILSTQHPEHGGFVYFTPIRPRHYRVYSQPEQCFWCCVGTGLENHGKYGQFIYAADEGGGLWVNLFIPSELSLPAKGLRVRQETRFPDEESTRLVLSLKEPQRFALHVRHPAWVQGQKFQVRINGKAIDATSAPSSYAVIEREWRDGDAVDVELPMTTRLERLPDGSEYAAVMHGPILLAAKTGTEDLAGLIADGSRMGHAAPGAFEALDTAPMLVGDTDRLAESIKPVPGEPLHFTAGTLIRPAEYSALVLQPFFRLHDARYAMYWRVATPETYKGVVAALKQSEAARLALEARTVDLVSPGEQQPEVEHGFKGGSSNSGTEFGRSFRTATDWFQYELDTHGATALELQLTHWGSRWTRETCNVEVNGVDIGRVVATGKEGEHFVTAVMPIPVDVLRASANGRIKVTFRAAKESSRVPPLFEVRLARAEEQPLPR